MTKQHFIAFAAEIKNSPRTEAERRVAAEVVVAVALRFNALFDVARFMAAAGL